MKYYLSFLAGAAIALFPLASAADADRTQAAAQQSADGRYLVVIAGCNDCHTVNWIETGGTLPEAGWLTGNPIGFRGPWGTTYPSNLRLLASEIDEDTWVAMLRTRQERPPMPWISTNNMNESDVRAIYRFVRSLGTAGGRMPAAVPPQHEPATPFILFEPQHMERLQGGSQ